MKDFSTFRTSLQESTEPLEEHVGSMMPPNILILRRQSVRQFPDHTMVALYYNDKLDQYFSIPYGGNADDVITPGSLKEAEDKPKTSQEKEIERYNKTAAVWKGRKQRWDAYKQSQQKPLKEDALNEISIPTASRAYHERQKRGKESLEKKDYGAATRHFSKAMKTVDRRAKKYSREDAGETVREHQELNEDAISHLTRVKNFETNTSLKHKDGTQTKVDPTTASMLLTVHNALHPSNRQKFADHLEASKAKFHKMVDFGWKQVK